MAKTSRFKTRTVLCENQNDGTIKFFSDCPQYGPWEVVPPDQMDTIYQRERDRQTEYNEIVGSLYNKTVILFGSGPMLSGITGAQIDYLQSRDDIAFAGVNALPKICRLIWGRDPAKVFNPGFIFAADMKPEIQQIRGDWDWDLVGDVPLFSKMDRNIVSAFSPTLTLPSIYWRDSVCGAINLAIIMMTLPTHPKSCGGPYGNWPRVNARPGDIGPNAKIILVGLEYNHCGHVYTDTEGFENIPDDPSQTWNMKFVTEGHDKMAPFAKSMGIPVLNAAPWSRLKSYPFCDFEDELDIPQHLRTGVSTLLPEIA